VDKEGYVQKEIKFALDKALEMPEGRIFIIPAKLEECDLPFSLRQYQAVNLYEKEGYTKLMKALKLRASQLERNTMKLPKEGEIAPEIKNVVEEKKPFKPEQEKLEPKTFEPSRESSLQNVDIGDLNITGGKNAIKVPLNWKPEIAISTSGKPQPRNAKSPRKLNTAIIVALIGLVGTIVAAMLGSPIIEKWFSAAPIPTESATATLTSQLVVPSKTIKPSQTPAQSVALVPISLPTEITDAKGVPMRLVPAGEFAMGTNDVLEFDTGAEKPVHTVYLDSYYIDKFEVTNLAYKSCVDAGVCIPPIDSSNDVQASYYSDSKFKDYPVVFITWYMAGTYCEWRGARTPTEAQWEKAARGDGGRKYPWGNDEVDCSKANYDPSCVGDATKVGSYPSGKSPYGVYDMAGNVFEWTADWFSKTYYDASPRSNPLGSETGDARVIRGGSWTGNIDYRVRVDIRLGLDPNSAWESGGFRCAKYADP
jgi:formylglycine-generating enzyme required for sulfatase activity